MPHSAFFLKGMFFTKMRSRGLLVVVVHIEFEAALVKIIVRVVKRGRGRIRRRRIGLSGLELPWLTLFDMLFVGRLQFERLGAVVAAEGPVVRVRGQMVLETGHLTERLVANVTAERLVARVYAHVLPQYVLCLESLLTYVTRVFGARRHRAVKSGARRYNARVHVCLIGGFGARTPRLFPTMRHCVRGGIEALMYGVCSRIGADVFAYEAVDFDV